MKFCFRLVSFQNLFKFIFDIFRAELTKMDRKEGVKFFMEQVPALSRWQTAIPTYLSQMVLFIFVLLFFYLISKVTWYGAIIGQLIVAFLATIPYRYIVKNSDKIRKKYHEKYKDLAGQKFWYHYESYTVPLLSSSLYFPLILKTDYFLPAIAELPKHFTTETLFPIYLAIPLGIFLCIMGLTIRKPSGGFEADVEGYFYVLYPKKGNLITGGKYKYVRNPRYLGRGLLVIGLGVLANNILAIFVAIIHFAAFASLIPSEEKELMKRFGDDFEEYKKRVPALIPIIKKR